MKKIPSYKESEKTCLLYKMMNICPLYQECMNPGDYI